MLEGVDSTFLQNNGNE